MPEISEFVKLISSSGISISTAFEDRIAYSKDWNPLHLPRLLKGEVPALPEAIVFPKTTEEVAEVLKTASDFGIPIYTFGGGSGVIDCQTPYEGGVVISTLSLDRIEFDEENRVVTAGAGVVGGYLERFLNYRGYTLRHSPQSLFCSTVGGWVATAASGQYSTGYGSIEDLVISITAVLPNGEVLEETKTPRRAGPDLKKLFIGSEGILGIVTEVSMKVFEIPREVVTISAEYSSFGDALKDARELMKFKPALMRIFDDEESIRYFDSEAFSLIAIFEGERVGEIAEEAKKRLKGEAVDGYAEIWLEKRFDVSDATKIVPLGFIFDTIEVACFWKDAARVYSEVIKAIRSVDGTVTASAHASHFYESGTCIYFTFSGLPSDVESYYREVWRRVIETSLKNGGNITHHHGIGRIRKRWLPEEIGTYYPLLKDLKTVFDRRNILNPGGVV